MRYFVSGITVASDLAFPELLRERATERAGHDEVVLRVARPRPQAAAHPKWFLTWTLPGGQQWLSCGKTRRGYYLLRFPELADFLVNRAGSEVRCIPARSIPAETIRHLFLDQVLPLALNLRGREAIHATCVLTKYGVCAFAGEAGAGKSTLAASFESAGCPVICDDCLALAEGDGGRMVAIPAYPGVRLWDDARRMFADEGAHSVPVAHYTSKLRVAAASAEAFPNTPQAISRIYTLGRNFSKSKRRVRPKIEPLSFREGFMTLMQAAFRLDVTDSQMLARQFDFLQRVAASVPIKRITLPNDLGALSAAREAIAADLRGSS